MFQFSLGLKANEWWLGKVSIFYGAMMKGEGYMLNSWLLKATPVAQGCKRHCKIVAVAVPASLTSMAAWMLRESADSGWMHTHAKRTNRLRKQYVDLQLRGRSPRHTAWMTVAQSPWSLDAQPTLQVHIPHGRDATDQHLHTLFHYGVVQRKHMIQIHLIHSH